MCLITFAMGGPRMFTRKTPTWVLAHLAGAHLKACLLHRYQPLVTCLAPQ